MEQEGVGDLERSVGYVLKQVHSVLRGALDEALRPLELTVPQYACLELLERQPGLSTAELARGAFVTRQSMNLVVQRLQERELLTRPDRAPQGRARPIDLTPEGRELRCSASVLVRDVEKRLFSPLPQERQWQMRDDLARCLAAFSQRSVGE